VSYETIRKLLTQRFNAAATAAGVSAQAIAVENVTFKPSAPEGQRPVPWVRLDLLPARPSNPTQGEGFRREQGILQATVSAPSGGGPQQATAIADVLASYFRRGWSSSEGTTKVWVDLDPFLGPGVPDGAWFRIPLSIPYQADIFG
jgi:uncharacterized protein DUF4128